MAGRALSKRRGRAQCRGGTCRVLPGSVCHMSGGCPRGTAPRPTWRWRRRLVIVMRTRRGAQGVVLAGRLGWNTVYLLGEGAGWS